MLTNERVARSRTCESLKLRPDLDPASLKEEIKRIIQAVPEPPPGSTGKACISTRTIT